MIRLPSNRRIGTGEAPFIIAEVGSNFRTLDDCLQSISKAKACGADAVKFQLYTAEELYGLTHEEWAREHYCLDDVYDASDMPRMSGEMPRDWIPILAEKAQAIGIEFMCSAFSEDGYKFLEPYVNLHKVATAENSHPGIFRELARQAKPVLMSNGPASMSELMHAKALLEPATLIPLYCVADYPARRVVLESIKELRKHFGCVGYSDHTTDVFEIPRRAVELGALVLEKHVNLAAVEGTPDAPHSLSLDEFKDMVARVRSGTARPSPQAAMVSTHRRRLIAIRDIQIGENFTYGVNYGCFRALRPMPEAMHAFSAFDIDGFVACANVKSGDAITLEACDA